MIHLISLICFTIFSWTQILPIKLDWNTHFKGSPDQASKYKALTFLELKQDYRAEVTGKKLKLTFQFQGRINAEKSWHKLTEENSEEQKKQLLSHEQQHVNLHFLMVNELNNTVQSYPYTLNNYKEEIKKRVAAISEKYHQIQLKYDTETNHGIDLKVQDEWENRINEMLKDPKFILHL